MLNNYPLGFYNAATLVKDAQRHRLHFKPLDINRSDYLFKVEEVDGEKQVRVGLKFVRGLRKEIGEAIETERDHPKSRTQCPSLRGQAALSDLSCPARSPYTSIADLIDRVPAINKREIRALSLAGALNFENTVHRRQALWQSEIAIQPEGELFSSQHVTHLQATDSEPTFLTRIEGLELIETDLKKTGISIGKHPMAFVRAEMKRRGILSAKQTLNLKKGQVVSVAGAVIIRQRPMTAKNVVFITLEDETGHSNFVVMPDTFEKYRAVINQNDYLIIRGIFEERGMIKSIHFEPIHSFTADVVSHNFR
jgi:error-prone DNA polymerase